MPQFRQTRRTNYRRFQRAMRGGRIDRARTPSYSLTTTSSTQSPLNSSPFRLFRSIVGSDVHNFKIAVAPFNMSLVYGASGNFGCLFYSNGAIPAAGLVVGSGANDFAMQFELGGVSVVYGVGGASNGNSTTSNISEYSALFDAYRINAVQVTMNFSSNSSSLTQPAASLPLVATAVDLDDVSPVSITELGQYQSYKLRQFNTNGPQTIMIKPVPKSLSSTGTGVTAVAANGFRSQWQDMQTTSVPYYGLKCAFDNQLLGAAGTSTIAGYITFSVIYHVSFRGVR